MQDTDQLKTNMSEDVFIDMLEDDPSELLIEPYPVVKPGGQYVGVVSAAVQVTHIPTDLKVICSHERSQNKNKSFAIGMIEHALSKII